MYHTRVAEFGEGSSQRAADVRKLHLNRKCLHLLDWYDLTGIRV